MTTEEPRQPSVFDRAFLTDAAEVCELLLIRHAQQLIDPKAPVGDLTNPPLSEQGRQQARLLGEALSTTRFDAIYTSPLERARATAAAIAQHQQTEPKVIDDLREVELFRDVPQDRRVDEFLDRDLLKAVRSRMLNERSWDVYPHSECSYDFRKRVVNAIEAAIAAHSTERIAVVCHGGVINAYIGHIIRSPYDMFFRPAHTSVNVVLAGAGRRVVNVLNDMHHLRTAEGDFHTY